MEMKNQTKLLKIKQQKILKAMMKKVTAFKLQMRRHRLKMKLSVNKQKNLKQNQ